ncbi:hypothetical protein Aab01nite_12780 [Paractinoplanes abujensis]|nr:hypothetical protein Aab01nite_12780 [Actinoplanes abujensis]
MLTTSGAATRGNRPGPGSWETYEEAVLVFDPDVAALLSGADAAAPEGTGAMITRAAAVIAAIVALVTLAALT